MNGIPAQDHGRAWLLPVTKPLDSSFNHALGFGDGKQALFWTVRWLDGNAPRDCYPQLFSISRAKCTTVADAITNGSRMRGLRQISSADLMDSFVALWTKIETIQLSSDPYTIILTPTANGVYSAKSASTSNSAPRSQCHTFLLLGNSKSRPRSIFLSGRYCKQTLESGPAACKRLGSPRCLLYLRSVSDGGSRRRTSFQFPKGKCSMCLLLLVYRSTNKKISHEIV